MIKELTPIEKEIKELLAHKGIVFSDEEIRSMKEKEELLKLLRIEKPVIDDYLQKLDKYLSEKYDKIAERIIKAPLNDTIKLNDRFKLNKKRK